jgi:hypothetical protein
MTSSFETMIQDRIIDKPPHIHTYVSLSPNGHRFAPHFKIQNPNPQATKHTSTSTHVHTHTAFIKLSPIIISDDVI